MIARLICYFKGHKFGPPSKRLHDDGWYGGDIYREPVEPVYEISRICNRCRVREILAFVPKEDLE